jgi:AcrR family transcriptional regulator
MGTREGDNRKQEFLDTALDLFYEKGYENTTINDIIDKVGLSKGAFYHYFNSKEEVLETIARQYVEKKLNIVEKVVKEENLNALEKLNKIIADMLDFKLQYSEIRWKIFKIITRNNNIKLENEIMDNFLELAQPLYEKLMKQGVSEGVFNIDYPEEAAELYVHLTKIFKKMTSGVVANFNCDLDDMEALKKEIKEPENIKALKRKYAFYQDTLERIFGTGRGYVKLVDSFLEELKQI